MSFITNAVVRVFFLILLVMQHLSSALCRSYVRLRFRIVEFKIFLLPYNCPVNDKRYIFLQHGFVNGLEFSQDGDFIVAGIGQEHRLGRWWRRKDSKNSVLCIPLLKS